MQKAAGRAASIGNVVLYVCGVLLLGSAGAKLAHVPAVVTALAANGFTNVKLTIVGLLEIVSAALLLIPRLRSLGLVVASAFLGGAIATHLQHDQSVVPPLLLLILIWAGAWLRYGATVLWSLKAWQERSNKDQSAHIDADRIPV